MLPTVIAISGMLVAEPAAPSGAGLAAVEISFVTHAGEGAAGRRRITRGGCYQSESGGSTGGAAYARDSQAGCHRAGDVAPIFARLDAIPATALVREQPAAATARGGRSSMPGSSEMHVILIRADGTHWVAANKATTDDVLRAANELPSENQWHAQAPEKSNGTGPQLVVLSAASDRTGGARFEGALASDGRWWCHRSVIGDRDEVSKLPAKPAAAVTNPAARLRRILEGISPHARDDAPARKSDGVERSVEVSWPGQARAPVSARAAATVTQRFGAEMTPLSPTCALR